MIDKKCIILSDSGFDLKPIAVTMLRTFIQCRVYIYAVILLYPDAEREFSSTEKKLNLQVIAKPFIDSLVINQKFIVNFLGLS